MSRTTNQQRKHSFSNRSIPRVTNVIRQIAIEFERQSTEGEKDAALECNPSESDA